MPSLIFILRAAFRHYAATLSDAIDAAAIDYTPPFSPDDAFSFALLTPRHERHYTR